MYRLLVGTVLLTAITLAAINIGHAIAADVDNDTKGPDKVKLLGHISDKDKPAGTETDASEREKTPAPAKDSSFIPVSKLGEYPNEVAPPQPNGRNRDDGSDKLNNLR